MEQALETKIEVTEAPVKKQVKKAAPAVKKSPKNRSDEPWWADMRERYNKPYRGHFRFFEQPDGSMPLTWHQFKGDPVRRWTLKDGETYSLPLGAIMQLMDTQYYAGDVWITGLDGKPAKREGKKIQRYAFEVFDFIADEDYQNKLSQKSVVTG
jgi:hypothetical protein